MIKYQHTPEMRPILLTVSALSKMKKMKNIEACLHNKSHITEAVHD